MGLLLPPEGSPPHPWIKPLQAPSAALHPAPTTGPQYLPGKGSRPALSAAGYQSGGQKLARPLLLSQPCLEWGHFWHNHWSRGWVCTLGTAALMQAQYAGARRTRTGSHTNLSPNRAVENGCPWKHPPAPGQEGLSQSCWLSYFSGTGTEHTTLQPVARCVCRVHERARREILPKLSGPMSLSIYH